jgi:hypothetical protein
VASIPDVCRNLAFADIPAVASIPAVC